MHFVIEQDPKNRGRYQVRLMNDKHQAVLISEFFATQTDCLHCIRRVKQAATNAENYILWDIDQHRFNLHYGTGLLVGAIRYKTAAERDAAVSLSRLTIVKAEVVDYTVQLREAA